MLPLSEVLDHEGKPRFQPGDEIDVMRDKGETEEGYINLSHQKAQRLRAWDEIEEAYNEKKPIKAVGHRAHQGRPDGRHSGRARVPAGFASGSASGAESGRHEGQDDRSRRSSS